MNKYAHKNTVESFKVDLMSLQPSQLYINYEKLKKVENEFILKKIFNPLPIKLLNGRLILTDGHTRALIYYLNGIYSIEVYWDDPWGSEFLDKKEYEISLQWCLEEKILSIKDLKDRIVSDEDYQSLWLDRCKNVFEQ